mgnify:CR=1 FL=1
MAEPGPLGPENSLRPGAAINIGEQLNLTGEMPAPKRTKICNSTTQIDTMDAHLRAGRKKVCSRAATLPSNGVKLFRTPFLQPPWTPAEQAIVGKLTSPTVFTPSCYQS